MQKTEHFTLSVKDNDTTKTANIKIVMLQSWHIFTRTRTIAMFYLKCKIVRTCDFFPNVATINLETFQRIYVTFTDNLFCALLTNHVSSVVHAYFSLLSHLVCL